MKRRILMSICSLLLVATILVPMLPLTVLAEELSDTVVTEEAQTDGDSTSENTDSTTETTVAAGTQSTEPSSTVATEPVVPAGHIYNSQQLEQALFEGIDVITIMSDFEVDRTFLITYDVTVMSNESHTITRAADFAGDIFVVGELADGTLTAEPVTLTLGNPESKESGLLIVDGNKNNLTVDVVGSAVFVSSGSKANLYDNLTLTNHKKVGNERALLDVNGMTNTAYIGGAAVIVSKDASVNVYGGSYTNNTVNTADTSIYGGAFYNFGTLNVYGGVYEGNSAVRAGVFYNYRTLRIFNADIKNNSSTTFGGAIYAPASTAAFTYIGGDNDVTDSKVTFTSNNAVNGGGAMYTSGRLFVEDATFDSNSSTKAGGAVFATGNYDVAVLNDTTFKNNTAGTHGGAVYLNGHTTFEADYDWTLSNVDFIANQSAGCGGAMYLTGGKTAYLTDVDFADNVTSLTSDAYGGAIYTTGSSIEINGATFTRNSAYYGGAMSLHESSGALLNNITADANTAVKFGGFAYTNASQLDMYNSTINNGEATSGGAMYMHTSTVSSVYNCVFEGNTLTDSSGNGGALFIYTGGTQVILHTCSFTDNNAQNFGGGMYISGKSLADLYNITANSNSAYRGGYAYITTSGTVVLMSGTTVSGNTASDGGPIIWGNTLNAKLNINKSNYIDLDATAELDDAYWATAIVNKLTVSYVDDEVPRYIDYRNEDPGEGMWDAFDVKSADELEAALLEGKEKIRITADFEVDRTFYVTSDTLVFSTSKRTLKRAADFAGDMFVVGENSEATACALPVTLTLGNPQSDTENLLIIDGNADNMTVDVAGTVVFVCSNHIAQLYKNITITNNKKVSNVRTFNEAHGLSYPDKIGGAAVIIVKDATVNVYGGNYSYNSANTEGDSVYGGAFYNFGVLNVYGGNFQYNSAVRAGAFYNYRTLNIYSANISNNYASTNGGAVYMPASTAAFLYIGEETELTDTTDVIFSKNSADDYAGAIYAQNVISVKNATFTYNTANYGGAVYAASTTMTVEDSVFTDNTAKVHGGAISVTGQRNVENNIELTVKASLLEGNEAMYNGGAVYLSSGSRVYITDTDFNLNTALATENTSGVRYGGGAIYNTGSSLEVNASTFTENSSDYNGGGIAVMSSGTAILNDITATGNTAGASGGFIYNKANLYMYGSTLKENHSTGTGGAVALVSCNATEIIKTVFEGNTADGHAAGVYIYTGAEASTMLHSCTFKDNITQSNGGVFYAANKSKASLYNITATGNTADYGGVLYLTTADTSVEINGLTVSGNVARNKGPVIWVNNAGSVFTVNKANVTDLDLAQEPDDTYWAELIANCENPVLIDDAIPGYADYKNENSGKMWTATDATNADELEAALLAGDKYIRVTADFELDRTFFVDSDTTIFSTKPHTLTRAADFAGDIFVIGENTDSAPVLALGNSISDTADLLVIDGNCGNMSVPVTGSIFFVYGSSKLTTYSNLTVTNASKSGNDRALVLSQEAVNADSIGGAVAIITADATAEILGGTFSANSANINTDSSALGGALYNLGTLKISAGIFEGNTALQGGAVYNAGTLSIGGTSFVDNTASKGGAIATVSAVADIRDTVFKLNTALQGGAVYAYGTYEDTTINSFTLSKSELNENSAVNGGAIYIASASAYINESNFADNFTSSDDSYESESGGAIYVTDSQFEADCLTLGDNIAYNGGALAVVDCGSVLLNDVTADGNEADNNGGFMYAQSTEINLINSSISANTAASDGGAVWYAGAMLSIQLTEFEENSAECGGAVGVNTEGATVTVADSAFSLNTATSTGGAVYSEGEKTSVNITTSTFSGNEASHGGAVNVSGANTALTIADSKFDENFADYHGGALYAVDGCAVNLSTSDFTYNTSLYGGVLFLSAATLDAASVTFTDNSSDYSGGVMFINDNSTALIYDCNATGNLACGSGGVIYNDNSKITIYNSVFEQNSSYVNGGVLALRYSAVANVYASEFKSNYTKNYGGAVYAYSADSQTLMHSCTFTENSTKAHGGAIYAANGTVLKLYNTEASYNNALRGGVLYITSAGTCVTVNGLTVTGNTASVAGPVVYGASYDATLNINKSNYTDTQVTKLDSNYWSNALAYKLTVNEINSEIPAYTEYGNESAGDMETAVNVNNADELEAAINIGEKYIRVTADFEIDRTLYITSDITIFSTKAYTIIRDAGFAGDMFVVGEYADGTDAVLKNSIVKLTVGNPISDTQNLLTIDGNKDNTTVDVKGTVFFVTNGAQVNLYDNLSVINCHKEDNDRAYNEKYTFSRPNRVGGAVSIIYEGILNVYGGNFKNNSVRTDDATTEETRNSSTGGVFYNYSNLRIYGGTFEANEGGRGAVVYNYRMMKIYGGSFISNHAFVMGGVYYAPNSAAIHLHIGSKSATDTPVLFKDNTAEGSAGVMYNSVLSAVNVYGNTVFDSNKSLGGSGGVICTYGQFAAMNTRFINNTAASRGGAIYAAESSEDYITRYVELTNSTFAGNKAALGGAVSLYSTDEAFAEGGIAVIKECTFSENQAALMTASTKTASGGALFADRKASLTVINSVFNKNTSNNEGGVIYACGESAVTVQGSEFTGNTSGTHGGAIALHSAYFDVVNSDFTNNTSGTNAGAVYVSYTGASQVNTEAIIKNANFNNNTSGGNGGAIYATKHTVDEDLPVLYVYDSKFDSNTAKSNGGAVLLTAGAEAFIKDTSFILNSTATSGKGGAVAVLGGKLNSEDNVFSKNSAYYGGGIYISSTADVLLYGVTATANKASSGGFIYTEAGTLNMYEGLVRNSVAVNGGAMYLADNSVTGVYDTVFRNNSAKSDGSGGNGGALFIYTYGTEATLHSCTFDDNSATGFGGAAYISGESVVEIYNITATDNSALKGGFMYETKSGTNVVLNGCTVSGNTATEGGSVIWGNTLNAVLNINKANFTDIDAESTLDDAYWSEAIVNLLTVNEIYDDIPDFTPYTPEAESDEPLEDKEPVPVDDVLSLGLNSSDASINSVYDKFEKLDNSSNFMSRNTTVFENINGSDVAVDTFVYPNSSPTDSMQVGLGIMIYQSLLYKQAYPDEEVYIDVSSYRFSVQAAVNINRNSRYFGYMRNLPSSNYDQYGFVRISYLLITAAKMGIHVNVIGQLDGYPISSKALNFNDYFTSQLNDPCDPAYVENGVIGDYMDFNFCYWTLDAKGGTDMMHTKLCAVSHYLDMNGEVHKNAVWTSSSNLDGIRSSGGNGNWKLQTATIVSDHEEIYNISTNYLRLISGLCGQEQVIEFQNIVNARSTEQIDLILAGRENEIPADEKIVYLGSDTDEVFEMYFTPFGGSTVSWDETYNPYCKYIRYLYESEDYIRFVWNAAEYSSAFALGQQMEAMISAAFHENKNVNNKIYVNAENFDSTVYSDLTVGEDIGFMSFNAYDFDEVHNKDIQMSYVRNGQRYYVSLLNSMNMHSGSMCYQSNFMLVIKETTCSENSVYTTLSNYTTVGDMAHCYGEEQTNLPENEDGYTYHRCITCGKTEVTGVAHHEGSWIVDREATLAQNGIRHKECAVCGALLSSEETVYSEKAYVDYTNFAGKSFVADNLYSVGALASTPQTFEAVIELPNYFAERAGVLVSNYDGSKDNQISLEVYTEGKLRLFYVNDGVKYNVYFTTDLRSDSPTHIALTVDDTVATLYVNGEPAETVQLNSALPEVTDGFCIGGDNRSENTQYFKGTIYSVSLYADVRTQSEINGDIRVVDKTADALLHSVYFAGDEHTEGGWIEDYPATDTQNGISHTECIHCGKVIRVAETGSIELERNIIDYTAAGKTFASAMNNQDITGLSVSPATYEVTLQVPKSMDSRAGVLVSNYDGSDKEQISLEIYSNGNVRFYVKHNGTAYNCLFDTDIRSDDVTHIAVTVDGGAISLYVNGEYVGAKGFSIVIPTDITDFTYGGDSRANNAQYFKGTIYAINLFSDIRTAEEIAMDAIMVTSDSQNLEYSVYFTE